MKKWTQILILISLLVIVGCTRTKGVVKEEEVTKTKQAIMNKKEKLPSFDRHIKIVEDPLQNALFYYSTRKTAIKFPRETFYVTPYIVHEEQGKKYLRVFAQFMSANTRPAGNTIFQKVTIADDMGNKAELFFDRIYSDRNREWGDILIDDINESQILAMNTARRIEVRFEGVYRYTFEMNKEMQSAFIELIRKYASIDAV